MRIIKNFISFLLFYSICLTSFSQVKDGMPAFFERKDYVNLSNFIGEYLNDNYYNRGNYDTLCQSGCAFVRFKIDKKGNVIKAEVNDGTPKSFSERVLKALDATSGYWTIQKKLQYPIETKYFILPVAYFFDTKCKFMANPTDDGLNGILKMLLYESEPNHPVSAFYGSYTGKPLDCIILPPLYFRPPFK